MTKKLNIKNFFSFKDIDPNAKIRFLDTPEIRSGMFFDKEMLDNWEKNKDKCWYSAFDFANTSSMLSLKTKADMLGLDIETDAWEVQRTGDGESEWKVVMNGQEHTVKMQTEMFEEAVDIPLYTPPTYAKQFDEARKNFYNDIKREKGENAEIFQFKQMFSLGEKHFVEDPLETMLLPPSAAGVKSFEYLVNRVDA